jgi:hypothetical protein
VPAITEIVSWDSFFVMADLDLLSDQLSSLP